MPDPKARPDPESTTTRAPQRKELRKHAAGLGEPDPENHPQETDTRDPLGEAPPRHPRSEDPIIEPLAIGASLGRFRLEKLIGQGGMGRVYEARDPRLRRQVAIKTLRLQDPASVHRFVREARLQASVSHPGICPVFEVGEHESTPYIVMQLLHGKPLDEASEGLHLEQKLVLVRRVAEAVHEAHRAGLIHRDLKPSNILVESNGPSPLHPRVLDFGIARAAGEADLTRDGEVVGTPAYMAPEQIHGSVEQLDRRTDVYALGATLYRLLAGRPPFAETGPAAFVQVLSHEPESLRKHRVPKDVEAIVFKCLEKQPHRRYGSARELARDIDAYLDGSEVSARPINAWYRLQKQLRRQKVAVRVGGVSALLLTIALGWGAHTAQQAESREILARRLTEQVEEIEALVRYSHLSPPHDIRPDRALLRRRMDDIAQAMDQAGEVGNGPGHFALGRGFLALGELEKAQRHLQIAWQSDYREPEVAAAMAQTLSALYRERLTEVELGGDWPARRHQIAELQKTYGHPARAFLAAIEERAVEVPGTEMPGTEMPGTEMPGTAAVEVPGTAENTDVEVPGTTKTEASEVPGTTENGPAENTPVEVPGTTENTEVEVPGTEMPGTEMLGAEPSPESLLLRALSFFHDDQFDHALGVLKASATQYAWSYELLRLEGDIHRTWAVQHHAEGRGDAARESFEQARKAYDRAATVAQSDPAIYRAGAQAAFQQLSLRLEAGADSEALWQEGLGRLEQALAIQPDLGDAWLWKSRFHRLAAQLKRRRAADPVVDLQAAIQAAERAKQDDDLRSKAWLELARAHWGWGQWLLDRREDPIAQLDQADRAFEEVDPQERSYSYWVAVGMAQSTRAEHLVTRGEPALPSFDRAADAFRQAAEQHSTPFAAWVNLGIGLFKASSAHGSDDSEILLEKSIHALQQAESFREDHVVPPYYLGLCHLHLAQGGDPNSGRLDADDLSRALDYFRRAQQLAPDMFQVQAALGETFHAQAIHSWEQGQDPDDAFARARRHHRRAMELAPESPIPRLNLAWTAYFEGKVLLKAGQDPRPLLDEAERIVDQVSRSLRSEGQRTCAGSVLRLRGEWQIHRGKDPELYFGPAEEIFVALTEDNPRSGEAFRSLGRIWTRRAERLSFQGDDPQPAFARARELLDRGLELSPDNAYYLLASAHWHNSYGSWLGTLATTPSADESDPLASALLQARAAHRFRPEWQEAAELVTHIESRISAAQAAGSPH